MTFFAIAAYVASDAVTSLLGLRDQPHHSPLGLAITALSLVIMPVLAWAKRRTAVRLGSVALRADAAETKLCTYLSGVVLMGLAANNWLGWSRSPDSWSLHLQCARGVRLGPAATCANAR